LVALALFSSRGGEVCPHSGATVSLKEVELELVVTTFASGVSLQIAEQSSDSIPNVVLEEGVHLAAGDTLWLGDIGLGFDREQLGRAARSIVQEARLSRGATSSQVRVRIQHNRGSGWSEVREIEEALERGLSGTAHFVPPRTLQIAVNMPQEFWKTVP
jgi:hypothetical protein